MKENLEFIYDVIDDQVRYLQECTKSEWYSCAECVILNLKTLKADIKDFIKEVDKYDE